MSFLDFDSSSEYDPWDDKSEWSETPRADGKPKVLIVGAGIGGLMLGNLLLKRGIPFEIYDRTKEIKPLGSAMILDCVSLVFQQLGIQEEFERMGKPTITAQFFNENHKPLLTLDFSDKKDLSGAEALVMSRHDLHSLLLRQIPAENIHLGKKILWFTQDEDGVTIRTADKKFYHGDILVGADGAYSAVRQSLYKSLKAKGALPASDDVPLPFNCVCLVGQTEPLDPEEFPGFKLPHTQFNFVVGSHEYSWTTFTTKQNTFCWFVIRFLNKESSKEHDSFRNSEWGPEQAESMCKEVRHFKVPIGKEGVTVTMGDLIDKTPKDMISKVMLEEKIFETWYGGRTVLLGDACHKMNPAGGAGAQAAIQDAVALANWISTLQSPTPSDLETIFKEYRAERYPIAKEAFSTSQMFKNIGGTNMISTLSRVFFKRIPRWLMRKIIAKKVASRSQASFLPLVQDTGKSKAKYQPSLHKTLEVFKVQSAAASTTSV
ncbi:hypothetical protein CPB97_001270 [Podila verticillata]|nr:hypothetical protein CPB97_001270 [Podila verticillata]